MSHEITSLFDAGHSIDLEKGQVLFRTDGPVEFMFLVEDGCVEMVRHTRSGSRLALSRVRSGCMLAEASAYSEVYHCDGVSLGHSRVKRIRKTEFHQKLAGDVGAQNVWTKTLARELQASRENAAIRSLRTVAEKVDVWLERNDGLPPKGELQALAQVLGISREALYREMAKRKRAQ